MKKTYSPAVCQFQRYQKNATLILYAAMALKAGAAFFPSLNFPSSVLTAAFFLVELFLLPPVGMAIMSLLASVLLFILPSVVLILLDLLVESVLLMVLGGLLCYAFTGLLLTFVNGVLISVESIVTTAPLAIAGGITAASAGVGAAVGYGTKAAIESAGQRAGDRSHSAVLSFLGSLLVLAAIGWPALSYSNAINGVLACKPAVILAQSHFNHINLTGSEDYKALFENKKKWVFRSGFYSDVIYSNNNNIIQGGKNMIAGNEDTLAVLLNGLLYVQDETMTKHIGGAGYLPKETDALVVTGSKAFVFGEDKVFVCGSKGTYTWKDTEWTTEFRALSTQEQFERIYDILERQNTTEDRRFSYEDVGVVAYAQRNGILLDYDSKTHEALFAHQSETGKVTVYSQTQPGSQEKLASFTPTYSGEGLPYTMVRRQGLLFLRGNQVVILDPLNDWAELVCLEHPSKNKTDVSFVSMFYADLDEKGAYCIYLDNENKIWIDTRLIGLTDLPSAPWNDSHLIGGFAGDYIYSIQYEDSPLSKLTYIKDTDWTIDSGETSGYHFHEIWMEEWTYQRLGLDTSIF